MIGVSRQQFGSAVEATAGLIPVVGPTAMNWVAKANFTAAKLNMRRKKVMESVSETLGVLGQFVDANVAPALDRLDQQVQKAATTANEVATVANDVKDLAKSQITDLRQKADAARSLNPEALKSTGLAAANANLGALKSMRPGAARKKFTRRRRNKKQWRKTRKSKTT